MDVGFAAVEPVPGKVHAERTFGVDQHIRTRRAAPAELAQRRGLPEHTRPPRSQRRVQEIPQARMDIGFITVEHVLGEVHAELALGVYQCIRTRRAASAKLAQRRGLPEHTRPPLLQCHVQEIPQARMDVGFITVEHVLGEVHAELALGVDQCIRARRAAPAELAQRRQRAVSVAVYRRTCARRFYSAAYRRFRRRGWT